MTNWRKKFKGERQDLWSGRPDSNRRQPAWKAGEPFRRLVLVSQLRITDETDPDFMLGRVSDCSLL